MKKQELINQNHLATFQAKDDETKALKSQLSEETNALKSQMSAIVTNAESQAQIVADKQSEVWKEEREKFVAGKQNCALIFYIFLNSKWTK